jgi:pyruvate kinase
MYDTRGVDVSGMYEKREVLTAVDKALLERAAKFAVDPDYVALSFASTASHLYDTERFLRSIGMTCRLLAKIETTPALRNAHRLAEASDGLVVARGDLALHMARKGIDMLAAERQLIKICLMHQKRCFVATRVADSLEEGRAELDKFEMHRLRTEVMNGDMITLVLCNETSGGTNAIRNVTIVKTTIGKILEELTVTSLGFSRESSDDR